MKKTGITLRIYLLDPEYYAKHDPEHAPEIKKKFKRLIKFLDKYAYMYDQVELSGDQIKES